MKNLYLPIFWKFSFGIIFIVTIFGTINIYLIYNNVKKELENESEKRAKYIASNLAQQAIEPFLYEDKLMIQKLVDNISQYDSSVVYSMIITGNNPKSIIKSFYGEATKDLINANVLENDVSCQIRMIYTNLHKGKIIRDVAVPILNKEIGTVRVGLIEDSITKTINQTVNNFLLMVGFFLVVGIIGALIFSMLITKPIQKISLISENLKFTDLDEIDNLAGENLKNTSKENSWLIKDELYYLSSKFNNMIARLKEAYQELKNTNQKLIQSEKMASIGKLSAGIAHEINNPNAGIQYCIQGLKQNYLSIEQKIEYLDMMEEASIKIENVVKGLLEYSRPHTMEFEEIDVNDVINRAIKLIKYKFEKYQIELSIKFNKENYLVKGSSHFLEQVFINLLMNSIDAISEKKSKSLYFIGKISIEVNEDEKCVCIVLKDNGIGIKSNNIEEIFNPFFTTKEVGKGTGLGLAICLNIINDHKGKIKVNSIQNEETKFEIIIPKIGVHNV